MDNAEFRGQALSNLMLTEKLEYTTQDRMEKTGAG